VGAAEPVPVPTLDHELALTDAPFQARSRFLTSRLVQGRRTQVVDAHALAAALQGTAVEGAAALSGRSGAGHDHGRARRGSIERNHETLLRKCAHARYFALNPAGALATSSHWLHEALNWRGGKALLDAPRARTGS
jgi:hypothetical protein